MSDSGSTQERYCSSYYDKHGLYNDGFPCPEDKYCCQTSDGSKMCCDINSVNNNNKNEEIENSKKDLKEESTYSKKSEKFSAKSNKFLDNLSNHRQNNNQQQNSHMLSTQAPPSLNLLPLDNLNSNINSNNNPTLLLMSSSSSTAVLPFFLAK